MCMHLLMHPPNHRHKQPQTANEHSSPAQLTISLPVQCVYLWVGVQVRHPLDVDTQRSTLCKAVGEVAKGLGCVSNGLVRQPAALSRQLPGQLPAERWQRRLLLLLCCFGAVAVAAAAVVCCVVVVVVAVGGC